MFDPNDDDMPLGVLVVVTAKMLAESMLEQDPRSAPPISLLIQHLQERGWEDAGLPTVEKVAMQQGIDTAPLRQGTKYRDLFQVALFGELKRRVDAALHWHDGTSDARSLTQSLARQLAPPFPATARGAGGERITTWYRRGLARWVWHHRAYDRLRELLTRERNPTDAATYSLVFERAFTAALPPPPPDDARPAPIAGRFRHIGPARPVVDEIPPPDHQTDYDLCYDPAAGALSYVQRNGERRIGPIYRLREGRWGANPADSIDLADIPRARLCAFYDPSRRGIACWTYLLHEIFYVVPVGVLFGPSGPARIAAEGAPPVDEPFGFRAVFAYDRGRDVTVAVTPNALCELSADGRWTLRLGGARHPPLPGLEGDLLGAAYDAAGRRVILWTQAPAKAGRRHLAFASWDGASLLPLPEAQPPTGAADSDQAAAICEHPVRGLLALFPGDGSPYALSADGFSACDRPPAPSDARAGHVHPILAELADLPIEPPAQIEPGPRWTGDVRAACDPADDRIVLGPGRYIEPGAFGSSWAHQILTRHAGAWSHARAELRPPPDDHRMHSFLGGEAGALVIEYDLGVRRLDDRDGWVPCAAGTRERLALVVTGPDETPYAVTEDGAVRRLRPAEGGPRCWQEVSPPADLPAEVSAALRPVGGVSHRAAAYDLARDRIVVFCQPLAAGKGALTAVWEAGRWTGRIDEAHPDSLLGRPRSSIRLFYDASLRQVLRLAAAEVSALTEAGWGPLDVDPVLCAVHPEHREVVRAADSGRVLILDLEERVVVGFSPRGSTVLGTYEWPDGFVVKSRPKIDHPGFPFLQVGACGRTRTLRTHSRNDDRENYALDLGPFFDAWT